MSTRAAAADTQKELSYRKRLIEIANMINSAPSIQDILVDIKDKILDLAEAERVTIFALDTKNQELFSLFKVGKRRQGDPRPQDLRLHRRLHRPLAQDGQHQERLRRRGAGAAARQPALRLALGQDHRLPHQPGAGLPHPVRQVPAGRAAAHQQARRRRLHPARRGGGRRAGQDPGHRVLQPAQGRAQQQADQVRPAGGQGAGLGEGHRAGGGHRAREPARPRQRAHRRLPRPQGRAGARAGPVLQLRVLGAGRPQDVERPQGAPHRRLPQEEHVRAHREARGHAAGGHRRPLRPHPPGRAQDHEPRPALRVPGGAEERRHRVHQRHLRGHRVQPPGRGPGPHHHVAGQRRGGRGRGADDAGDAGAGRDRQRRS